MTDFIVTGSADAIAEILCGPRQYDEHLRSWRWHAYLGDTKRRMRAVDDAAKLIMARAHREEQYQQAAE